MARTITHVYIHTAAAAVNGKPVDQSAAAIRSYHMSHNKWTDIGYNAVCRFDGTIEPGRPHDKIPAGVLNDNTHTLHLCFTGHGDFADLTPAQKRQGAKKVAAWLKFYGIADDFLREPKRVVRGHREYWERRGEKPHKTCPGKKVSCDEFRKLVAAELK